MLWEIILIGPVQRGIPEENVYMNLINLNTLWCKQIETNKSQPK